MCQSLFHSFFFRRAHGFLSFGLTESLYTWSCIAQASFGPTHSSLAELKGKESYEAWIVQQMALDAWFALFSPAHFRVLCLDVFAIIECY